MELWYASCRRKHHKEAVTSFQHAVVAAPGDARPLLRLGNALFAAQQFQDSQEAFGQALSSASLPEDAALLPKIHVNLGISLEAEGQLELACQHYRYRFCAAVEASCSMHHCSNVYRHNNNISFLISLDNLQASEKLITSVKSARRLLKLSQLSWCAMLLTSKKVEARYGACGVNGV